MINTKICPVCGMETLKELPETMYFEDEVIQSFQEALSRIGGQHHELNDLDYFKLLLKAKITKRCQKK